MTWVRIDDLFPDHPKIMGLSDKAFRLHIVGLCYSARALTDGHVPAQIVRRSCRNHARICDELVTAGVWAKLGNGYEIHDYAEYQPTRERVLSERENTAHRVQRWRDKKRSSNAVTNGAVTPLVTVPPSHPIPSPPNPHTVGEQEKDLEPLNSRDAGTNPRAQKQRTKAQRAHAAFVARTKGLYHQWLAEDGADPATVAEQIRNAYPDIAEEVLA